MEVRIVGKQKLRVVWSSGTINSDFCDRKSCRLVCNDVQYEQCALSCFNSISS